MQQESIKKIYDRFKDEETRRRQHWEPHWQDVTDYILPNHGFYESRGDQPNSGKSRDDKIIDGVGSRAIRTLGAGMQGGLTSPARPWFRLHIVGDEDLMRYGDIKQWIGTVEKAMYWAFSKSNFYDTAHTSYIEVAGFGTACLFEEGDLEKFMRFRVMTTGEYVAIPNRFGVIDTLMRRLHMRAKNVVDTFGEKNCSGETRDKAKKNPDSWIKVIHAVLPREDHDPEKVDALNMPFASVYFEEDHYQNDGILSESGFAEFPFFVPRWMVNASDAYGRGPGRDTLGDIKMLQSMQRAVLIAQQKGLDPPLIMPTSLKGNVRTFPGGINFADVETQHGARPLYEVSMNLQHVEAKIERLQMAVREGFYNDLFLMILERPNMTATEVAERHEEKLLMLGPVIERQMHEFLDPLIDRTFGILYRAGKIPPPPPELEGLDLNVEYISMLAQAQRLVGTHAIDATVGMAIQLAQANPEVLDNIDFDKTINEYGELTGAPAGILRTADVVAKIRERRDQMMREEQAKEEASQAVEDAKTLSDVNLEEQSGLRRLLEMFNAG